MVQQCTQLIRLYELVSLLAIATRQKVMPDDHSEVVPLLPIPNRTVKRLCADDSADSRVKVGHRQAVIARRPVYGRGVLIRACCQASLDENAKSVLECESSLTTPSQSCKARPQRQQRTQELTGLFKICHNRGLR
jgi:hypothetical protein